MRVIAAMQRELEVLFDRYDEDCSGSLDYNEFGQHLLGLKAPPCSDASKSAIERASLVFKFNVLQSLHVVHPLTAACVQLWCFCSHLSEMLSVQCYAQ
jgi:hypothetical protein